jgi:hypothetical protein
MPDLKRTSEKLVKSKIIGLLEATIGDDACSSEAQ